jgi:hypothetical protein
MFDDYFGNNVSGAEQYQYYRSIGLTSANQVASQLRADYMEMYPMDSVIDNEINYEAINFLAIAEEIIEDYRQLMGS